MRLDLRDPLKLQMQIFQGPVELISQFDKFVYLLRLKMSNGAAFSTQSWRSRRTRDARRSLPTRTTWRPGRTDWASTAARPRESVR